MNKKKGAKNKTITFELVQRSVEDPLNADPNASQHVLVPIYIGSDVDQNIVDDITKQMSDEQKSKVVQKKKTKKGIGSQYNEIFGMPDDGVDYSKFFKCIDEENDDGVFVAPDGSVHDLKKRELQNVDGFVQNKLGFDKELFGTEVDPNMPKLVDDTLNPLGADIDPDVLLAMDDPNADVLDDDFISKCLDAEAEDGGEEEENDDEKAITDMETGEKKSYAKSRMSAATSHSSHISHRSENMDFVEEKVEYLMNTVYNDEEDFNDDEGEEEDNGEVDWNDIMEDFKQYVKPQNKLPKPTPKPAEAPVNTPVEDKNEVEQHIEEEEKVEEEIYEEKPKEKWDCESYLDTMSTTENLPTVLRDENIPKRKKRNNTANEPEPQRVKLVAPDMQPKEGETKEEAKERKKKIKEYNRQRRAEKKATKQKFVAVNKKVKKSIAASGGSRGAKIIALN